MVLHLVGIGLGVGQHLAGGVNDGHPRIGGVSGLPGNLAERRRGSFRDAGSKHQGFLP